MLFLFTIMYNIYIRSIPMFCISIYLLFRDKSFKDNVFIYIIFVYGINFNNFLNNVCKIISMFARILI